MLGFAVVVAVLAAASPDPTLAGVERAFSILRDDRPLARQRARTALMQSTPAFDDLATADNDLQRAFRSDVNKPWRGLPHERVLSLVTLAALDIGAGHCDLAVPTLKNAAFHDLRLQPTAPSTTTTSSTTTSSTTSKPAPAINDSDAVVVHALLVHCLKKMNASAVDVDAAIAGLKEAAALAPAAEGVGADAVQALLEKPGLRLVFAGTAPRLVRQGSQGEQVSFTTVDDDGIAFQVSLVAGAKQGRAKKPSAVPKGAVLVWSSARQATTAQGQDIKALLSQRAGQKQAMTSAGTSHVNRGLGAAPTANSPTQAAAAAGLVMTGLGMQAVGSMVDARADTRQVSGLPDSVFLIAD